MLKGKRLQVLIVVAALLLGWFATASLERTAVAKERPEYEELELFTDVLSIIRKSYVEQVPVKDLIYGAVEGMLSTLDPHSSFMSPEMFHERKIDTKGEFGGLGIEITIRDGILTVVSPIEDTPAFRAGLEAGDQIIKIDDQFTKDLGIMDAVKLMRGPRGSDVTLTIMREAFDKPRRFTLTRDIIQVHSVKSRTLEDGFGYVRLAQFQERSSEELQRALEGLREENGGRLQGVILDLRNNPGGLLDQAVGVADLFLKDGLIVYTEGREPSSQMRFSAESQGTEPDYPMVVLINGGSASASEIVAGALKDHQRALILGTRSFGKGSVQTLIPLTDDSGVSLTTARYYTPNGTSIQATGITPDIQVKPLKVAEESGGEHFREKDLKNHFEAPEESEEHGISQQEQTFRLDEATREDFQLMRALDLLKGWFIFKALESKAA